MISDEMKSLRERIDALATKYQEKIDEAVAAQVAQNQKEEFDFLDQALTNAGV